MIVALPGLFSYLCFFYGIFCLFFLLFFSNKQEDITPLSKHFIIIQFDQDLCPLTKLMNTIENTCMNGQKQSRKDPDETVWMHRLILRFVVRTQ